MLAVSAGPAGRSSIDLSIVTVRIAPDRAAVIVADDARREVYGQRYFDAPAEQLDERLRGFIAETQSALREAHAVLVAAGRRTGLELPDEASTVAFLKQRTAELTARR